METFIEINIFSDQIEMILGKSYEELYFGPFESYEAAKREFRDKGWMQYHDQKYPWRSGILTRARICSVPSIFQHCYQNWFKPGEELPTAVKVRHPDEILRAAEERAKTGFKYTFDKLPLYAKFIILEPNADPLVPRIIPANSTFMKLSKIAYVYIVQNEQGRWRFGGAGFTFFLRTDAERKMEVIWRKDDRQEKLAMLRNKAPLPLP